MESPADANFDGVNLLPHLSGENNNAPHDALYWRDGHDMAIRNGDWKLVYSPNVRPMRGSGAKAASRKIDLDQTQLFNLADDPGEQADLADSNPKKREQLAAAWTAWSSELAKPLWEPPVRAKKRARKR